MFGLVITPVNTRRMRVVIAPFDSPRPGAIMIRLLYPGVDHPAHWRCTETREFRWLFAAAPSVALFALT
jgi:hypothetical protein